MSTDYVRIERAIRYLEENFRRQPTLDELAEHLHLSPFHLQRLFTRWAGISPKRFVQFLTAEYAKEMLRNSATLLETSYESGLSGPGRLHDLMISVEAVTPGEYKSGGAGLQICYGFHDSPFGTCLLAATERGVCGLSFATSPDEREQALEDLRTRWPAAEIVEAPAFTQPLVEQIFPQNVTQLNGTESSGTNGNGRVNGAQEPPRGLTLLLNGTNFQVKVWEALLRIPSGALCSYEDVAHLIDRPSAARAVGGAVGANPIAYLIPCHRVIRKSGVIREYRWGSMRKKAMIGWEAAALAARQSATGSAAGHLPEMSTV
jgi:AraC family transcriptional regulator of adaptative response/methylated-DNA-[protein]-cysteine methyltransferase